MNRSRGLRFFFVCETVAEAVAQHNKTKSIVQQRQVHQSKMKQHAVSQRHACGAYMDSVK